jgi:hypothetical protein
MGMLGRIARDFSRFAPTYEHYRDAAALPPVADSADVDRASSVTSWPMYCNGLDAGNPPASPNGISDCTIAAPAHGFTAMGVYAGKPQVIFDNSEIIKVYSRNSGYNATTGASDTGCEMQDVLADLKANGMTDVNGKTHTVAMYAALKNPNDPRLLSEVLNLFGWVYVGINCPASAQDQFGKIWDYAPGSPDDGGHAIALHRRQPYGSRIGVFDYSTWGALQHATLAFNAHYIEEAWAVASVDWIEANGSTCTGLDLAALESDMALV